MRFLRRCLTLTIVGAGLAVGASPALALEQPTLLSDDDLRLGVALTPTETAEAREFCAETLGRASATPDTITRGCNCFPHEWEIRTSRLHRLVLPIAMAPDAPGSRRNLAIVERQQGGVHEDRLRQLSAEYQQAARQAFKICR